ncbi:MAG: Gfo/Idh/MocA family oxidoreductase [Clostridia bacterium]|nr:Gfo/Idh/MocA family oxidoreductase [Clostridia bacterium]
MIKIAQIGICDFNHGKQVWNSINANSDIFEVVGFALPENERLLSPKRVGAFDGYREMTVDEILSNPDIKAVTIETEEKHLTKYALMAAKAGKHIHMEKPGGQNLAEFEELIETVRKNKTVLHIGYMYRYNPYIMELTERIKSGEFGEIISVEAQMSCYHKLPLRKWLEGYMGGSLFYLGCHLIDLILQIQGTPTNIIPLNKRTQTDGINCTDYGFTVFEYPNGVSFAKVCSLERGGYFRRNLVITGTKANAVLCPLEDGNESEMTTTLNFCDSSSFGARGKITKCEPFDRYLKMMRSFGEYVLGEKNNPYTLDYELELYKTILKACGVIVEQ